MNGIDSKRLGTRSRLAVAALAGSIALLLVPASPTRAASPPEDKMRHLINHERIERGRTGLKMSKRLVTLARRHSRDMADDGAIYHNDELGSDLRYCDPSVWGENVGMGGSVPRLHDLFMASAPHRKNILKAAFDRVGVGVVTRDGTIYVTVVFVAV